VEQQWPGARPTFRSTVTAARAAAIMIANLRKTRAAKAAAEEAKLVARTSVRASWGQPGAPLTPRGSGGGAATGERVSNGAAQVGQARLLWSQACLVECMHMLHCCSQAWTVAPLPPPADHAARLLQELHRQLQVCVVSASTWLLACFCGTCSRHCRLSCLTCDSSVHTPQALHKAQRSAQHQPASSHWAPPPRQEHCHRGEHPCGHPQGRPCPAQAPPCQAPPC
jgi:hypothetical protein